MYILNMYNTCSSPLSHATLDLLPFPLQVHIILSEVETPMGGYDGDVMGGIHDEDGYYNDEDDNLSDTDPEDDEWETAAV